MDTRQGLAGTVLGLLLVTGCGALHPGPSAFDKQLGAAYLDLSKATDAIGPDTITGEQTNPPLCAARDSLMQRFTDLESSSPSGEMVLELQTLVDHVQAADKDCTTNHWRFWSMDEQEVLSDLQTVGVYVIDSQK